MAEAKLEEAKVLWGQGEETKGLSIVRQLLKLYKSTNKVRAEALLYTGNIKCNALFSTITNSHIFQENG